ncbi:unnamed protein product [Clonostachys rosea]|uniref:Integral membrane protein n=1 Tax=Bionectria ochroleuca TaxID=29856 RepID=A0ABY6UDQ1_BIOOC|nr:unnamed protein product [Clonostachys rosea]
MDPYQQTSDYAPPTGPPPGAPPQGIVAPSGPPPGSFPGQPNVPMGYGQAPVQGLAGRGRTPSYSSAIVDEANRKWGAPPVRRKPVGVPVPLPQQQQQQQQQQQMGFQPTPVTRTSTSSSLRGMMNTLKSKAQVEARALAKTVKQYQNEHSHGAQSQNHGAQYQAYGAALDGSPYASPGGQTYQYNPGASSSTPQAQFQAPLQQPATQTYQYQYPGAVQSPATQPTTPSTPGGYVYGGSSQQLQSNPAIPAQNPTGAYYSSTADVQSQSYTAPPASQYQYNVPGASAFQNQYPVADPGASSCTYPQTASAPPGQPPLTDPNLNVASSPAVANFSYGSQYPDTATAVPISQGQQSTPEGGYAYPGTAPPLPGQQPSVAETGYGYPGTAPAFSEPQQTVPDEGYRYPGTAATLSGPQTNQNPPAATNVVAQDQQQQQPIESPSVDTQPAVPAPADDVNSLVSSRIESSLPDGNIAIISSTPVVAPKPSTRINAALLDPGPAESPESPPSAPQTNSRVEAALQEPIYAPGPITTAADSQPNARINAALQGEEKPALDPTTAPPIALDNGSTVREQPPTLPPPLVQETAETSVPSLSAAPATFSIMPLGLDEVKPLQPTQSFPPMAGEQILTNSQQSPEPAQHHAYPATAGPEPLDFHAPATVPGLSPFEHFSPAPPPVIEQDPMPNLNAPVQSAPVVSDTIQDYGLPGLPPGPPPGARPVEDFNAPAMPPPPGVMQASIYDFQPPAQVPPPGPPAQEQPGLSSSGDISYVINDMGNLSLVRGTSAEPVRDPHSAANTKDKAWIEDVPRRLPPQLSENGQPNEAVWFCPGNTHDNGYAASWFYLPSAPDFLICTRCYADHLKNTNLASSFEKKKTHGARCRFNVPRITSVLVPQCIQAGSVELLAEYMAKRIGIKDCTLKQGFKGSDGIQVWLIERETNDVMKNFIACQACYEDHVLASKYAQEFIPRQQKYPEPQPASSKWSCDLNAFGYSRRSFTIYSRNNAPFMDWVEKATKLFQLPDCEADKGVESSSREWVRPKDPVETMVICEKCYFNELCWTTLEDAFEYIPVPKPITNSERMDYVFGHRDTQATSWTCDATVSQIENVLAGALLRQDAAVFSRCARTIMSSPKCVPEGIANGTWYTPKGGPSNYMMCASCFAGFCDAFLECSHMFELSPLSGSSDTIVCSFNSASPRRYQFLFSMYQAAQEGVWSIATNTIRNYINIPECPRNNHVASRRWYGWSDCLICQDCYQEVIKDMRKGLPFELEDQLVQEERMCSMYSPRMREKFAMAVEKGDSTELVEYSRVRIQVWTQTIPQIKMLRQMQEMQMMSAMSAGMAGIMYQGAAGIQSVSGATDGYLHGNSSIGWHDTENGATSAQKFNEMSSGMSAANSGGTWGQIFMLQAQWERYE